MKTAKVLKNGSVVEIDGDFYIVNSFEKKSAVGQGYYSTATLRKFVSKEQIEKVKGLKSDEVRT